jgi:signal transduction histidine kinase
VWFGGLGPAVVAMVVGYAIVNVRYISEHGGVSVTGPAESMTLALFALSCSLIIVLGEAMRRARDRYRVSEAEVKERARELQRADANKSRFLAVLSHELRNPLAPLRTGLALLRMRGQGAGDTAETHDMMERQIAQLSRLIDDLLDVSRIDRGKLELRTQRLAVGTVLQTAIDTAKPNIDAQGHELVVRHPAEPLYCTPTSPSSISTCRTWTASRWRGACASRRGGAALASLPLPVWDSRPTSSARARRGSTSTSPSLQI